MTALFDNGAEEDRGVVVVVCTSATEFEERVTLLSVDGGRTAEASTETWKVMLGVASPLDGSVWELPVECHWVDSLAELEAKRSSSSIASLFVSSFVGGYCTVEIGPDIAYDDDSDLVVECTDGLGCWA